MAAEKLFENQVKKYLRSKKIYYFKYFGNGYSTVGIPDLIMCVNGYFVAVEIKSETGKITQLQFANIQLINEAGGVALILRPSGFEDFKKLIERMLQ